MQDPDIFPTNARRSPWRGAALLGIVLLVVLLGHGQLLRAQTFSSGSTGADGALNLTTPGTLVFDPRTFTPPLDPDGDNVYHFTSITIGAGVTVRLSAHTLNGPVFWLASGPVQIEGIIDLNGENGHQGQSPNPVFAIRIAAVPGAGGFPGGIGGTHLSSAQPGSGPGRGGVRGAIGSGASGDGAGHATPGSAASGTAVGGPAYGNNFLVPLLGGSGGGGQQGPTTVNPSLGGGGGAGGGALLIASSTSIALSGTMRANGGSGSFPAGAGSGGAIRLVAPMISGTGTINAVGGTGGNGAASGRIRLEAFQHAFTGTISPTRILTSPIALFLPSTSAPSLRVISVAGIPVAADPTGSFTMPDVTINVAVAAPVAIEARNVPPGTVVQLQVFSENGPDQTINSPPLVGTQELSTTTASVVIPPGFSRGFVRATWTP